jgi:hypothetical protein
MRRVLAGAGVAALAATFAAAVILPAATAAAASGTFSVLAYNIAGLPELISSAPTPRASATTAIGQRLGPYDIVEVQEDFNYHSNLYAADAHPHRTPTSGGAGFGSGLNTLSNYSYDTDDFERVRWNSCNLSEADCLTPKGFTFMRLRLAEGVYVDFYNLHADAGSTADDIEVRADNLNQLTSFIASHSAGNAVVVAGDTNTRYTRTGEAIASFVASNGLTDAWVKLIRGGVPPAAGSPAPTCDPSTLNACEVVDKVLYRSSRFVTLDATYYNNDHAAFLDSSGRMLSDHDPIAVRFAWSTNTAYEFSEQFGGPGGGTFNDIDRVPAGGRATTIFIRSGSRLDRVGLTLSNGTALEHGGTGGTLASLTLGNDEYVTTAYLCRGQRNGRARVFHARFTTNLGRTLAGGSTTSDCITRSAPPGWQIAGFHGRSGTEVDKIGFIYTSR